MATSKRPWIAMQMTVALLVAGVFLALKPQLTKAAETTLAMEGSGTISAPYQIATCLDLQDITLDLAAHYALANDIDCSASNTWNSDKGFIPIGMTVAGDVPAESFSGTLNGQNYTISGLTINQSSTTTQQHVGLFSAINGKLFNFSVAGATITGTTASSEAEEKAVGGIAGASEGTIAGVHFDGDITVTACGDRNVGGIAGRSTNVTNSSSNGTIATTHSGCTSSAIVVGGLVGTTTSSPTVNSYGNMDITVAGDNCANYYCITVGGLIGNSFASIGSSYSGGSLNLEIDTGAPGAGFQYAAGLVGYYGVDGGIYDSFTTTAINVPPSCIDQDCLAGPWSTGGFIGLYPNATPMTNTYYDQTASGVARCDIYETTDCIPVNTDGLSPNYFVNNTTNGPLPEWDFTEVWQTTNQLPTLRAYDPTPLPPTDLVATIASTTAITVSWTPSVSNDINWYSVLCKKTGAATWNTCQDTISSNETQITIVGLDSATQYDFKMIAYDTDGFVSTDSAVITGTTGTPGFGLITNCQQLQDIANNLSDNYELANDIDCSDTITWNDGAGFLPIGSFGSEEAFIGVLAGNNYTIKNLYIDQITGGQNVAGLFALTSNAIVQDITFDSPVIIGSLIAGAVIAFDSRATSLNNVHVNNGTISGTAVAAGGLVGYSNSSEEQATGSKNSFVGSITSTDPEGLYYGGLYGGLGGNFDFTNNYAQADITVERAMGAGGLIGFTGNSEEPSGILTNSYAAGNLAITSTEPTTDPESHPVSAGGGLIGIAMEGTNGATALHNSFAAMTITNANPDGIAGGLVSGSDAQTNPGDMSTSYFDADLAGTTDCMATHSNPCTPISGQSNYFKNNATNPPLNVWNFSSIWMTTSQFPVFSTAVTSGLTTIPPERLVPRTSSGGNGGGADQAIGASATGAEPKVATLSGRLGTATVTPSEETGVLGAIKTFVRSLPAVVVVGFPYALFIMLGLATLVLLIELIRELRRLHLLQILIRKQQLLAEERDAFWHLAANYLRAPATLIVGGAEALNDVKSTTTTRELGKSAALLQNKIAEIMKKIEGSTSLQAISQTAARPVVHTARRAAFIIPVVSVAILAILGNYAAASFRNMSPSTTGYLVQVAVFIIVAIVFYWTLGLLSQGKNKRKAAEAQLSRQTNELANARHELINDTAKNLNPDLTKLEELFTQLPATQAASEPAQTLHEGSKRLREIVTSFAMLIKVQEGTGQVAAQPKAVDLTNLLNRTRAKLTPQITAKGVRVVAPALPLAVHAEADLANQVLESIVANAVDYSPANGTVKVEAQQLQDKIRLRISDQGKGIDKKQLDHLFQPFTRADGTSAMDMSHGGFGINLYLDKLIMEQMGGTISAVSTPGKGTAITMEWPV